MSMGRWLDSKPGWVRHSHVGRNEQKPADHQERSGSQSRVCKSRSLRVSSWVDEIKLNRKFPTLSGEMRETQAG